MNGSSATRRGFLGNAAQLLVGASFVPLLGGATIAGRQQRLMTYRVGDTDLEVSRIGYACANLATWSSAAISAEERSSAQQLIEAVSANGITLFDHADVYAFGKSEQLFGEVLVRSPGLRDRIFLQSKCGKIFSTSSPGSIRLDVSHEHIVKSVEGSLRRLNTDHLDMLLLHAFSTLGHPEEIAAAFDALHSSGKVRCFGVCDHTAGQIELLRRTVRQPLVTHQVIASLAHPAAFAEDAENALDLFEGSSRRARDPMQARGILEYCRANHIRLSAVLPFEPQLLSPPDQAPARIHATARLLRELSAAKQTTPAALAISWLLHHPAGILPIVGDASLDAIKEYCAGDSVVVADDEWYALLAAATTPEASTG